MSVEPTVLSLPSPGPLDLAASALFLDLDGTLAPILARPQDVRPDARRTRMLEALSRGLGGRLAVVTGRTLADVDRILENRVDCVAAVHGLVRRDVDGVVHEVAPHPSLARTTYELRRFAVRDPGLIVEEKGASVALHYRMAQGFGAAARAIATRLAGETGLVLQPGDMVVELRTPGPAKGDSIRVFMETPAFRGATPVFVGDDITDENGFAEVARLGGSGVLVGRPRKTAALWGLCGVADVAAWLESAR